MTTPSVLVVDDNVDQLQTITRLLREAGISRVAAANSVQSAIEIVTTEATPFDIVIADPALQGNAGLDLFRRLATTHCDPAICILSSLPESIVCSIGEMVSEFGLRFLGTFSKPLTPENIACALARFAIIRDTADSANAETMIRLEPAAVRGCLRQGLFEPYYQPKVFMANQALCGVEALARCRHPKFGVLPPSAFIQSAEEAGLIDELTFLLLERVAVQLQIWRERGFEVPVAMNISPKSLANHSFCTRFFDLMAAAGVAPDRLIIEVGEEVANADAALYLESLNRLRLHGTSLSIDDFGSGNSSMQQLSRIPFTELKLDRTLTRNLSEQPRRQSLVEASIRMAQSLHARTVVQGVESIEDWQYLRQLNFDIAQGYLISVPLAADAFLDWQESWNGIEGLETPAAPAPATTGKNSRVFDGSAARNIEKMRVLIVDDDNLILKVLSRTLAGFGIKTVVTTDNVSAALEILQTTPIDLIISDVMMPDINGLDFLKLIRTGEAGISREIPVILVTSLSSSDTLGVAMKLDVNGFIVKPFRPMTVMLTLIKALEDHESVIEHDHIYEAISTDVDTDQEKHTAVAKHIESKQVGLLQLRPGMQLTTSVKSKSGALVLPVNTILKPRQIGRLQELEEVLAELKFNVAAA